MDAGCGHDLISQRKVKRTWVENMPRQCKLHVLNQTPAVLSVGSRCTKEGYSYVWPNSEDMKPVMVSDDGICTFLEVDGDIPYLIPGNVPSDDNVQENQDRLLEHLESHVKD